MSLAAWLRLTLTSGIGGETQRKLLAAFGLPEAVFTAGYSAVRGVIGERPAGLLFDSSTAAAIDENVDAALAWAEQPGCHLVTLADPHYPQLLLQAADPPNLLYVRGNPELLNTPALAIVGSRNATPQGNKTAEDFAQTLAERGLTIVSGLALGIDGAAHRGALAAKGRTIAVIGTGVDRVYPARHKALATQILECGAIVSEFPLGTPALAANFPRRNRIISGLARGVLVVEAALQSGSLITARLAGEQGREVFAIPGSIHSPLARGCHQLIKQGAKLVEGAADVLDELGWQVIPEQIAGTLVDDHPILAALGHDPCTVDDLAARTGLATDQLLAQLLTLELDGQIAGLPGNRYQRLA
ncbi:MAG TPA: DNA-processing protein DprA [Rhodocyclaceae bacterium]|nr:DNA-processing protein DprA [Rhodocyclaceae bacterium]